ncbi:uncharacterized protein VTP21DRAFT_11593 [Calcarisporiella thermophila]|uniref:uncharacterized protein n=1 Tax=Calcarisporiella thermophila TaxID=911321 RepID=UPI0037432DE5
MSFDPFADLLDRLHLSDNPRVASKASENYNRIRNSVLAGGAGGRVREVVCVQLACEALNEDFNYSLAQKLSVVPQNMYTSVEAQIRRILKQERDINFSALTVQFGCTQLLDPCERIAREFREKFMETLDARQQELMRGEWEKPVYCGVVFWACCRAYEIRVEKSRLQHLCCCTAAEFNSKLKVVEEFCGDRLRELKRSNVDKPPRKRKKIEGAETARKRRGAEADGETQSIAMRPERSNSQEGERQRDGGGNGGGTHSGTARCGNQEGETVAQPIPSRGRQRSVGRARARGRDSGGEEGVRAEVSAVETRRGPVDGIVAMIPTQRWRETRRYAEFLAWKRSVLQRVSNGRE